MRFPEDKIAIAIIVALMALILAVIVGAVAYLPASLVAQRDCLKQGFPHGIVTFDFGRYCVGYDGAIHPVIVPQVKK